MVEPAHMQYILTPHMRRTPRPMANASQATLTATDPATGTPARGALEADRPTITPAPNGPDS